MTKKITVLLLFFISSLPIFSNAAQTADTAFKADVTLSSEKIALNDPLTLHVNLTFPDGYHPNIDQLSGNLLTYSGMDEPPFTLVKRNVSLLRKSEGTFTQTIDFILSPQLPGTHALTLQIIRFDKDSSKEFIEIPTDIFSINVTVPQNRFQVGDVISPPIPISERLPITLSEINRRKFQHNDSVNSLESHETLQLLKEKEFPWITVLAALVTLIAIIIIRTLPSDEHKEDDDPLANEKMRQKSIDELKKLVLNTPKDAELAAAFFVRVDSSLRSYLDTTYHIGAASSTFQELSKKTEGITSLDPSVRAELVHIFQQADNIKFAKRTASSEDSLKAKQTLSNLIANST